MQQVPATQQQKIGRLLFLGGALIGFLLSIALWFSGSHTEGIYVGLWVPSILAFGTFWFVTQDGR